MLSVATIALLSWSAMAWPTTEVEKREYKTMLTASHYNGNSPCASSPSALSTLATNLASAATAVGISSSGSFALKSGMPRTVKFYDTPLDCRLYKNDFAFRMRRESGETNWEGTLKVRSGDRYFSSYRRPDMNSCGTTDLGGKFEEDLNLLWQSKFSYSHNCEISNSKNINKLDDITDTYDQIYRVFDDEFGWTLTDSIAQVSNLQITECVYEGFVVDFNTGGADEVGEFAVSLWYDSSSASNPKLAEVSFTITSTGSVLEDWNENTIMNAHFFWEQVGTSLSQIDPNSSTKTAWVYGYNSTWCS
ncbi:hypothetical protein ACA910_019641 [Epithemia clementina (nom. ined.)]